MMSSSHLVGAPTAASGTEEKGMCVGVLVTRYACV